MKKNLSLKILLFTASFCCILTTRAQQITSFTLMNAQTDTELQTLANEDIILVSDLSANEFSIRANTSGNVGSLVFEIDSEIVTTENNAPYALLGNSGSNYTSWIPELRTYTITGSLYSLPQAGGALLDTYSITITFTDQIVQEPFGPGIVSLVLINADTNQDIVEITNGSIFNFNVIGTMNLNIRADVTSGTESVIFNYQGIENYKTENFPVYAIGGNGPGNNYNAWIPELGTNTVTATAFSGNNGNGFAGESFTVNFEIINENTAVDLPALLRLNSGGETITIEDKTFITDAFFEGNGKSYTNNNINNIFETTLDAIYKTERSTLSNLQSFNYNIPVTDGDYDIALHFAEIYFGATGGGAGGIGKRIFNVSIEGEEVLTNFDLNAEKNPMTAIVKMFSTNVTDGELNIVFTGIVNQPKVSAIEIFGNGSIIVPEDNCEWNELANSSLSKVESQSVKINNKLYTLAGFLSGLNITAATEVYDPETNIWSTVAPMPTAVTHMGAVGVGSDIWIVAGFEGNHPGVATDKVQIYNTVTDTWSYGPPLPNPRGSGAAVFNNGKIHFFGGLLPNRVTDVGEHYFLDLNNINAGWQAAAPLPDPRNHLSGAAVNGKIYAIGGQFGHDNGVQDQKFLDEYNPETDTWTRKADLPSARSHFEPGTLVHNNKIIIVGGRRGGFFFEDVTEYDPASDSWTELCELPSKLLAPAAKVFGDRLIVANGGENGTCCPKDNTISIAIEPEIISEDPISVLIYHETNGFRHGSISAGINMITEFGNLMNWTVDESQSSDVFNIGNLSNYDVVVWLNTSGNGLLNASEQSAFQTFIQNNGGFVGVHAATDTYRDGSWSWYNDLVGGIVQVAPNHTANNTNATMDVVGSHPAIAHLGTTWNKNEEYYYWELNGGYLFDGNINLLNVRSTGSNSYDSPRPVTWYKNFDGGRSFYTALGHNSSDYQSNENFRTLLKEAIIWAAKGEDNSKISSLLNTNLDFTDKRMIVYPNPFEDYFTINSEVFSNDENQEIIVLKLDGSEVIRKFISRNDNTIYVENLPTGYYLVKINGSKKQENKFIYKK